MFPTMELDVMQPQGWSWRWIFPKTLQQIYIKGFNHWMSVERARGDLFCCEITYTNQEKARRQEEEEEEEEEEEKKKKEAEVEVRGGTRMRATER